MLNSAQGSKYVYTPIGGGSVDNLESNSLQKKNRNGEQQNTNGFLNILDGKLFLSSLSVIVLVIIGIFGFTKTVSLKQLSITSNDLKSASTGRPNIVFVLIDDLGWNETEVLSFASPFMHDMAEKGIKLTNYYSQEICTPARASLMTGRYPVSVGMQYGVLTATENWGLDAEETLFPEVMREHGDYKTYMLGKWNLGHSNPVYLPTSRGFDYFLGYLDGQNYYWSKNYPSGPTFTDFMYSDKDCFDIYDGTDMTTYSSTLYADKAVRVIDQHDFSSNPMFLYFSAQAVHDPFVDAVQFPNGNQQMYSSYDTWVSGGLSESSFEGIMDQIDLSGRRMYVTALSLLDNAVKSIYKSLDKAGQLDNTIFIVASDNGGCFKAGAKNGPLRGTKGSLFEGGTKVDAFIYSPLLTKSSGGTTYSGLMHVSDWFPTILGLSGISFTPKIGFALDGVDQSNALRSVVSDSSPSSSNSPREYLLYNAYVNVEDRNFDLNVNGSVAVRNDRYKLMHGFSGSSSAMWFDGNLLDDGAVYDSGDTSCSQLQSLDGTFSRFLFDLQEDPNELRNLYDSPALSAVQTSLYKQIEQIVSKQAKFPPHSDSKTMLSVMSYWKRNGNFLQPWNAPLDYISRSSPSRCAKTDSVFSPIR